MFILNFTEKGDIKRGIKRPDAEFAQDFWNNFERGEYDLRTRIAKRALRKSEREPSSGGEEN